MGIGFRSRTRRYRESSSRQWLVLLAIVAAAASLVAAYFLNLVTDQAPLALRKLAWPMLVGAAAVLLVLVAVQAWRTASVGGKSLARRAAERRQTAARIEADVRRALDKTFAAVPRLELRTRERPDLVRPATPMPDVYGQPDKPKVQVADLEEIFNRNGRSLLLLGAGGSGKSTLLAELCFGLCRHISRDSEKPLIPVMVNLTTWSEDEKSFKLWLTQAIVDTYPGIVRDLVIEWADDRALILLLDGLDEIETDNGRKQVLREIDDFLGSGPCPIVVACRTDDIASLTIPSCLRSAVEVLKPSPTQVKEFLASLNSPAADSVNAVSPQDRPWWSMISTPLMLGIVAQVSKIVPEADLVTEGSARFRRRHIIKVYVDTLLLRRAGRVPDYRPQDARRWLGWLAVWMKRHGRTEFYIDRLPPAWINDVIDIREIKAKPRYWMALTWLGVTGVSILAPLVGGQINYLALFVNGSGVTLATSWHVRKRNSSLTDPIQTVWTLRGRWIAWSLFGLIFGLLGILAPLAITSVDGTIKDVLLWTLGTSFVSIPATLAVVMVPTTKPNQAGLPAGARIRRSERAAWKGALLVGLPLAAASGIVRFFTQDLAHAVGTAAAFAVICMTSCWLIFGGVPVLQYRAFFRKLNRTGRGPADYLAFLDWATERLLLQSAGSALRFSHKEVQRYLAESWPATQR